MNKFIAILKDKRKGSLTTELLNQHVEHLRTLTKAGHMFLCGPFKDNDGALQVIMANSKLEAEAFLNKDPFIREKYYQGYDLFELIEANDANNWLLEDAQTKLNSKV